MHWLVKEMYDRLKTHGMNNIKKTLIFLHDPTVASP